MNSEAILTAQVRGEISPQIALSRLLLAGETFDERMLARAPDVAALASQHRARIPQLLALARGGVSNRQSLGAVADLFDQLARASPEAAVAFYSFGDEEELSRATEELLDVIVRWSPPLAGRRAIDVGCGIGRLAIPLADAGARVLGVDVSAVMIAEARRRAGERTMVTFEQVDGLRIPALDGEADLLLVVDCLPYLADADAVAPFIAEAARLLSPGGDLLVFNWSYRGDSEGDIAEARVLAERNGLELLRAGERPFRIWDAAGFQLRRPI